MYSCASSYQKCVLFGSISHEGKRLTKDERNTVKSECARSLHVCIAFSMQFLGLLLCLGDSPLQCEKARAFSQRQ